MESEWRLFFSQQNITDSFASSFKSCSQRSMTRKIVFEREKKREEEKKKKKNYFREKAKAQITH